MQIFKILGRRAQKYYFIALAILLAVSACGKSEVEKVKKEVVRPAKIITVGLSEGGLIRSFPAKVKASKRPELAFRVGGELRKLPIKAGNVVKTGQKLAQLDQTDYQLRLNNSKRRRDRGFADLGQTFYIYRSVGLN